MAGRRPSSRGRRDRGASRGEEPARRDGGGLAWLAGVIWLAACAWGLGRAASPFATEPLAFASWENLALLAQPRNEPHALRLASGPEVGGRREHAVLLEAPRYEGPVGLVDGTSYVRDSGLREEAVWRVGFYFEREAGVDAPLQGDDRLGIVGGELRLPGGRVLELVSAVPARRGRLVEFEEIAGRRYGAGPPGLKVMTEGESGLYLRGVMRSVPDPEAEKRLAPLGRLVARARAGVGGNAGVPEGVLFYPEGRCAYRLGGTPPSRLALVAAVHGVSTSLVAGVLLASGLLVGGGFRLIARGVRAEPGRAVGRAAGAGVALAIAGFGLVAGLVVVPLQGPDENRHQISYARLLRSPSRLAEMIALGKRTHYEAIRWRPDEKIGEGRLAVADGFFLNTTTLRLELADAFFQDYRRRSPAMASLWRMASWVLPSAPGGHVALGLRWVHVVVGAGLLGLGAGVLAIGLPRGGARWVVVAPLVLMPLVPLLAAVSNYSLLTAAAGLTLACLMRLAVRFDDDPRVALVTGLGLGLMLQTSINAAPFVAGVAVWLLHRPGLRWMGLGVRAGGGGAEDDEEGQGNPGAHRTGPGLWCLALAGGFGAIRLVTGAVVAPEVWEEGAAKAGLSWLGGWADPAVFWCGYCGVLALLEAVAGGRPLAGLGDRIHDALAWGAVLGWPLAGVLAASALWFSVATPTVLPDLDQPWRQFTGIPTTGCALRAVEERGAPVPTFSRGEQVREVLKVVGTNLSARPRDFVLMRMFWSGLLGGDARVSGWVAGGSSALVVAGLVAGLVTLAQAGSARRTLLLGLGLAAMALALAALAASYWPRNVVGRYATPLLLLVVGFGVLGWSGPLRRGADAWPRGSVGLVMAACLLGPLAWLGSLLERFY